MARTSPDQSEKEDLKARGGCRRPCVALDASRPCLSLDSHGDVASLSIPAQVRCFRSERELLRFFWRTLVHDVDPDIVVSFQVPSPRRGLPRDFRAGRYRTRYRRLLSGPLSHSAHLLQPHLGAYLSRRQALLRCRLLSGPLPHPLPFRSPCSPSLTLFQRASLTHLPEPTPLASDVQP